MRPIAPRTGGEEVTLAEEQPEYKPITVAVYPTVSGGSGLISRWTMTPDERRRVAEGEDIYVILITNGHPMQPIQVHVGTKELLG